MTLSRLTKDSGTILIVFYRPGLFYSMIYFILLLLIFFCNIFESQFHMIKRKFRSVIT